MGGTGPAKLCSSYRACFTPSCSLPLLPIFISLISQLGSCYIGCASHIFHFFLYFSHSFLILIYSFFFPLPPFFSLPLRIWETLSGRELPSPHSVWLRELKRSEKGGLRKHVRRNREEKKTLHILCKAKYTSVFHYNHSPYITFPLCLNYLSFLIKIDFPFLTRSFHLPYFSFHQKNNLAARPTGSNENCQHMMLIFLRSTLLHQRFSCLERLLLEFLWWIMVAANYRANGHSLQLTFIQHHQPWHAINVHGEVLVETTGVIMYLNSHFRTARRPPYTVVSFHFFISE